MNWEDIVKRVESENNIFILQLIELYNFLEIQWLVVKTKPCLLKMLICI